MKPSELLDQAADEVLKGWCQGKMGKPYDPNGEVCANGALSRILGNHVIDFSYDDLVLANDALFSFIGTSDVPAWNDRPDQTAGSVADALRSVSKDLREQGN